MFARRALHAAAVRSAAATVAGGLALALLLTSCRESDRAADAATAPTTGPLLTPGSGATRTFYGQGTYYHDLAVKRAAGDWEVGVEAKGGMEVLVASFSYEPGAYTGWHRHPGPVFIQVLEGTVTFFEEDDPCTPIVVPAGHGYLDTGEHAHIGRNLTDAPAKDLVVYLAPPGTPSTALRIDAHAPEHCP